MPSISTEFLTALLRASGEGSEMRCVCSKKSNIVILNIILEEIDRTRTARVKKFVDPLGSMKVYVVVKN